MQPAIRISHDARKSEDPSAGGASVEGKITVQDCTEMEWKNGGKCLYRIGLLIGHTPNFISDNILKMNIGSHSQHRRFLLPPMREARCSFGWLAPWLALFAVMLARAQPINIDLSASGSGTVETPCPRPYQVGQG